MRQALERLDPVWDNLFPAEQARIVQLLVARAIDVKHSMGSSCGYGPTVLGTWSASSAPLVTACRKGCCMMQVRVSSARRGRHHQGAVRHP